MSRTGSGRSPRRPDLLFAYGTLMRGFALNRVLAARSTLLGDGAVRGRLLDLGRYPGLVVGAGRVHGEIYRLDDPELLPVLDREEGYNFERRRAIVTLANGRRARAWVYRSRGPQNRAVPIPDGDYRRVHPRPATGVRAAGRRGAGAPPAEAR